MSNVEDKAIVPYIFKGFRNRRKLSMPGVWFTALFLLASLIMILSLVNIHPTLITHAATRTQRRIIFNDQIRLRDGVQRPTLTA